MSWDDSEQEERRYDRPGPIRPSREAARKRAATVGTALLITAVIGGASNVGLAVIVNAIEHAHPPPERPPPSWVGKDQQASWERGRVAAPGFRLCCAGVTSLAIYLPVFLGSLGLHQGRGWGLGLTAAIMAMLPCSPGFLVGLPVGIWSLIVLSNSDVKDALRPRRV
jgi:hypothetical protein